MVPKLRRPLKIGILGGGQLSLMLAEAAMKMGIETRILAEGPDAPVAQVFAHCTLGSVKDPASLRTFFSQVDLLIFENEFVNCEVLKGAARGLSVEFIPSLDTISQVQDKLTQKEWLGRLGVPSADYYELNPEYSLEAEVRACLEKFNGQCVLKWAKLGYDGKGVMPLASGKLDWVRIHSFVNSAKERRSRVFAERKISFKRELALVAVYSRNEEFHTYPLVISEQKEGICSLVYGPAVALGVDQRLEQQACHYAKSLAKALSLYGSFAIEFFETDENEILVNEIAPRIHNSGHYTQDACATDQFENHLRAVLGVPIGSVQHSPGFAMLNVLGPKAPLGEEGLTALPKPSSNTYLHWYRKKQILPGRKLGHLNGIADATRELPQLIEELKVIEQDWIKQSFDINVSKKGENECLRPSL
jgi:5-(carboxyamino)imidazole ribonucleotide synthase